jgi:hypothetical protein
MSNTSDDKRLNIINLVKAEIYGPIDTNSQEIVNEDPLMRYFCGVLYPQKSSVSCEDDEEILGDSDKSKSDSYDTEDSDPNKQAFHKFTYKDLTESEEDFLNLSNAYKQSALSISVAIDIKNPVKIQVTFARYNKLDKLFKWKREPYLKEIDLDSDFFSRVLNKTQKKLTLFSSESNQLSLYAFYRWKERTNNTYVVTFSIVNESKSITSNTNYPKTENSFFQVQIKLLCDSGFEPIAKQEMFTNPNEDTQNNKLIYRNEKQYAVGHGCSPIWDDRKDKISSIYSDFLPTYEIKAIVPTNSSTLGINLSMKEMYEDINGETTFKTLDSLCNSYSSWIQSQKTSIESPDFESKYKNIANSNIDKCLECLQRMRNGIEILKNNSSAFLAFRLMNKAMLLQQLHSKLEKRRFIKNRMTGAFQLEQEVMPDFEDETTWPKGHTFGSWRAFQIAFILITIKSIVDHSCPEHDFVDLIWFPTGGGKTEAYLGLSSFIIFYKRIKKTDDGSCSQIIMRYTLRLLTSQQYERAAALICSMEHMRRDNPSLLGEKAITIGLWVGGSTTPNTMKSAIDSFKKLNSGESGQSEYPFVITKCPWCGAEIGPSNRKMHGIRLSKELQGKKKIEKLYFSCENPECDFHVTSENDENKKLPLSVIDEKLYDNPPTLLIGTVDKFAILPYRPEAKSLFGLKDGPKIGRSHPELIIQDELHLISGPLGSTVSAYETMVDFLCSYEENNKMVHPKVIASTATISQAKKQCHELFDVPNENVKIFPPSCLESGKTFFSTICNEKPGRKYVGIYSPGAPSSATSAIHILSAIFEGKHFVDFNDNINLKDAYWTNVCYYNSIRELAQAVNWVDADIYEHSKIILRRTSESNDFKLKLPSYMELNSRNQDNIASDFEKLNHKLSDNKTIDSSTLDFCFATNMISVGIDIDRLGLMTVFGQPKTTSEYIQATSRVGRDSKRPGLIFVFYNPGKPRDKSIFESFETYHSKFYSFVEPTSISPFCSELRCRVIPAILLGITRFISKDSSNNGYGLIKAYSDGFANIAKNAILKRVSDIDPTELKDTEIQINSILDNWVNKQEIDLYNYPLSKGDLSQMANDPMPAICPDSKYKFIPDGWKKGTKAAPTSMRSVDLDCKLEINDDYDGGNNYGQD